MLLNTLKSVDRVLFIHGLSITTESQSVNFILFLINVLIVLLNIYNQTHTRASLTLSFLIFLQCFTQLINILVFKKNASELNAVLRQTTHFKQLIIINHDQLKPLRRYAAKLILLYAIIFSATSAELGRVLYFEYRVPQFLGWPTFALHFIGNLMPKSMLIALMIFHIFMSKLFASLAQLLYDYASSSASIKNMNNWKHVLQTYYKFKRSSLALISFYPTTWFILGFFDITLRLTMGAFSQLSLVKLITANTFYFLFKLPLIVLIACVHVNTKCEEDLIQQTKLKLITLSNNTNDKLHLIELINAINGQQSSIGNGSYSLSITFLISFIGAAFPLAVLLRDLFIKSN